MAAKKSKRSTKKDSKPKRGLVKRAKDAAVKLLTTAEKSRLVKPPDAFVDLAERFARAWDDHKSSLRVPGLSSARVRSLVSKAQRAAEKEQAMMARMREKLEPLSNARLRAEHEAWKAVLDAYAMAKAGARRDATLSKAFEFLGDALSHPRTSKEPAPTG
jgi:hypothetical protein